MKISNESKAYIAGFLDGDGSIYVRLKRNDTYKYHFQISPYIVFYQSTKNLKFLKSLQKLINVGYLRDRNDGISEWIIGDIASLNLIIDLMMPYLKLKKKQALLMKEILYLKQKVKTKKDFLRLCGKIDKFSQLNYSKKRSVMIDSVKDVLNKSH